MIKIKKYNAQDIGIEVIKNDGKADTIKITGYANTKDHPDAYGDIPSGDNIYDVSRFMKNPVAILNHDNRVEMIVGRFTRLVEDKKGLYFELRLMENPQTPETKHAVEAYRTGYGIAFSIAGEWQYNGEDINGARFLTKAIIHHIALVAIGADEDALSNVSRPKGIEIESATLASLENKYGKDRVRAVRDRIAKTKR